MSMYLIKVHVYSMITLVHYNAKGLPQTQTLYTCKSVRVHVVILYVVICMHV